MEQYGIFLLYKDNLKHAGSITIDPSGVLIVKGGEGDWNYGVHKQLMSRLREITLNEALYKKHGIDGIKEKLPVSTQRYEARRLSLDINFYGLNILRHDVEAYPVTIDDTGKMGKLEYS